MEPDLDRLFDFESHGGLFPQFEPNWDGVYSDAKSVVKKCVASGSGRKRVALMMKHPLSFVTVFLAFAREETDLFLFNPGWGSQELNTARQIAACHIEITDGDPGVFSVSQSESRAGVDHVEKGRNPLRVMIPTGGTSGRIRFAIHNWSTLAAAAYGFQQHLSCTRTAGHCVLPLYHVSGFMQLIRALLSMGSLAFGRTESFCEVHKLLEKEPIGNRFLSLVSTQLERLLKEESNHALLREYRAIFIGGGPAPIGLLDRARELRLPLAPTYGMTETAAQIATLLPEAFLKAGLNQGKTLPHATIRIVDEENSDEVLAAGEVGLVKIYAASLFRGYYGEKTDAGNAAFLTSDLARLDSRGNVTVLGRADRVIITGGEKVNPREVEMIFEKCGFVSDVFCFGREDREWGEALCVAYVPQDVAVTENVLQEVVSGELTDYKVPKHWIRLEKIPRNEAGKPKLAEIQSKTIV